MEVSIEPHAQAASSRRMEPHCPLHRRLGLAPEPVLTFRRGEESLLFAGIRTLDSPTRLVSLFLFLNYSKILYLDKLGTLALKYH